MSDESMHWADQIAREIKDRVSKEDVLKEIVKEKGYLIYDEKTPSGSIHIGSGRGWIIHDAIAKAMRDLGLKAKFVLSSDDIDPYDKPNKELPSTFDKYLGMPFRDIPSPEKGYKSFADYYFTLVTDKFEEFGIECELESTGERYEKGDFNAAIKKILDNTSKVNDIFERFYGNRPQKLPFNPICEKCGKIGTTIATEWDAETEKVKYKCSPDAVKWAKGCGHEGEISPYDGKGKLPWKVEWAAKWPTVGVVCELAGKDHLTHGGSRSISIAVSDEVLDFPPPYPSTRKAIGKGYEFFTVGGKKMSTSKGTGMSFVESTMYAPAKIFRYLLIATRPHAVLDFNPTGRNDLILLYDRFDKTERIYFKKDDAEKTDYEQHKRIYELSHIGEIPSKIPIQIPFSFCSVLVQVTQNQEKAIEVLSKLGHLPSKVSDSELEYVQGRLDFASTWVKEFAPDEFKFDVQSEISDGVRTELSSGQISGLKALVKVLETKEYTDNELYEEFYGICKEAEINPKEFFQGAYRVLLNRDRGPKLAGFILTIGKEKVVELLKQL